MSYSVDRDLEAKKYKEGLIDTAPLCLFYSRIIQQINPSNVRQHHRGDCQSRMVAHMQTQITREFREEKRKIT